MRQNQIMWVGSAIVVSVMALTCGCGRNQPTKPTSTDSVYVLSDDPAAGSSAAPQKPTSDDVSSVSAEAGDGRAVSFAGLRAVVPSQWIVETPTSSMRAFQARVPGADGAGDASMVVFAGISGSVESNIERWKGQFRDAAGESVEPRVEHANVGPLHITTATLSGTYASGMSPEFDGPGITMMQSIVEKPDGSMVFIRLLGPSATVSMNRDAFMAMLASLE